MTTIAIVYAYTGEVGTAVAIGGIEVVAKLAVFYMHERAWQKVAWGEEKE